MRLAPARSNICCRSAPRPSKPLNSRRNAMVDDGWNKYTRGTGSLDPLVRGRPVVFKDGEYFVDGEPLAPDGQYVVLRLIERWTKWPEGQPPEHVVAGP